MAVSISRTDRSIEYLSKGIPMGVAITTETITPAIALKWLESINTNNRKVDQSVVNQYASDMATGAWHFTGDPIQISEIGVLLNGQHRLWAVVESGVTLQFVIIRGLPSDIFAVLDAGKKRTMGQVLTQEGVQNASHVGAAVRHYLGFQRGWLLDSNRMKKISRDEQVAFALAHNDSVQWSVKLSMRFSASLGSGSSAAWSAFALALEEAVGRAKAEDFLIPVLTGVNLAHGDPRLSLRNWAIQRATKGAKNDPPLQLATSIIAFNKWAKGRKAVSAKVWDRSTPFPVVQA